MIPRPWNSNIFEVVELLPVMFVLSMVTFRR